MFIPPQSTWKSNTLKSCEGVDGAQRVLVTGATSLWSLGEGCPREMNGRLASPTELVLCSWLDGVWIGQSLLQNHLADVLH